MKRTDLAGAVHGAGRPAEAPKPPAAPTSTHVPTPKPEISPSRAGKRGVVIYVEPELGRRLKILAAQRDSTIQAIGLEAFEHLLARSEHPR